MCVSVLQSPNHMYPQPKPHPTNFLAKHKISTTAQQPSLMTENDGDKFFQRVVGIATGSLHIHIQHMDYSVSLQLCSWRQSWLWSASPAQVQLWTVRRDKIITALHSIKCNTVCLTGSHTLRYNFSGLETHSWWLKHHGPTFSRALWILGQNYDELRSQLMHMGYTLWQLHSQQLSGVIRI